MLLYSNVRLFVEREQQLLQVLSTFTRLQEPIPTSLLKMNNDHASRAVKMFAGILKYMGDSNEPVTDAVRMDIAQKLLHQGLKRPELKDELYMQLVKQTRCNPKMDAKLYAWELFHLVASTMPPSKVKHHVTQEVSARLLTFLLAGLHRPGVRVHPQRVA